MAALRPLPLCLALLAATLLAPDGQAEEVMKGRLCYALKTGEGYALHVMDADGRNDRAIPNLPGAVNLFPTWSPDGKRIAFMSGASERENAFSLYLINADGTGLKRLAENEAMAALPAWSPDGKTILFMTERDGSPQLMATDGDGGNLRPLQTGLQVGIAPFFSPDGKRIGFTGSMERSPGKSAPLYVANPDGSGAEVLVTTEGFAVGGAGSWSPDGKAIAYLTVEPQHKAAALHTLLVSDKVDSRLMDLKLGEGIFDSITLPCWSPDSKWIVISQPGKDGKPALWRISPAGKMPEQITPAGAECICPAWSVN